MLRAAILIALPELKNLDMPLAVETEFHLDKMSPIGFKVSTLHKVGVLTNMKSLLTIHTLICAKWDSGL
jgi:hypothetical protein